MVTERIQKAIDSLLEEAVAAISRSDWAAVRDRAQNALALDPENLDANALLAAADWALMAIPDSPPIVQRVNDTTPLSIPATASEAERRQLTVMFCDLQGSTALSQQLDPEELRDVIRSYQEVCAGAVTRFEGYIAKYLGDGLLIYYGYPQAHEDDPQRAVRSGLAILERMTALNERLRAENGLELAVRIGVHTGLVVAGEMGSGDALESLAIVGETPNVAARLQEAAEPNTLVISDATAKLIQGFFLCDGLGARELEGINEPMELFAVRSESGAQTRFDVAASSRLMPLSGREQGVGLLLDRWDQAKEGLGQVVLLGGEAGIGKSRLIVALTQRLAAEPHVLLQLRCSAYHQNSVLYPVIDFFEQWLEFRREDSPEAKLDKLEMALSEYRFPLHEAVPLLAGLLSVPLDGRYESPTLDAQGQREETLALLAALWMESPGGHPVLLVVDDLHWADPSTLELLGLLLDQAPTTRTLAIFGFRPDFKPAWEGRAYLTQITLNRLTKNLSAELVGRLAGDNALPEEVIDQIVSKSDGVPLFIEELTRMVMESYLVQESAGHYQLTGPLDSLAIPTTLQDSLTARLDRLGPAREVAQLGAVLGREFSYDLIQAVSPLDEEVLRGHLQRLVASEFLYQRGLPAEATFTFKHALIRDASYESLLRSARQQYHRKIAEALETGRYSAAETQPELLAYHFTEAGLTGQAAHYLQRAGEQASANSANQEARAYFQLAVSFRENQPMDEDKANTLFGLGRSQLATSSTGAFGPGLENLILAFDYFAKAGDVARAVVIAEQHLPTGAFLMEGARLLVTRALDLVDSDSHEAGRLAVRAGMYLGRISIDNDGAQESFRRALRIAVREGDVELELLTLANMAEVNLFHLQIEESRTNAQQALATARKANHLQAEVQAHQRAVLAAIITGNTEEARYHASAGIDLSERLRHRWWIASTFWGNQTVSQLTGDWRDAREFSERGSASGADQRILANRVLLEYGEGRVEDGDEVLETLIGIRVPNHLNFGSIACSVVVPLASLQTGKTQGLERARELAQTGLSSSIPPLLTVMARSGLALIAIIENDVGAAREHYDALHPYRGILVPNCAGCTVDRLLGLLSRSMGDLDQAVEHFEDALAFCRMASYRPELAWTSFDYAETLEERDADGDRAKAMSLLDESLSISTEVGMRPLMERAMSKQELLKA